MNLGSFAAFRAVMLAGTVSGAAQILGRSQPAVSRLLDKLEHDLGVQLFERRKGLIVPTAKARALMTEIERAYLSMDSLRNSALRLSKVQKPQITIASMAALGLEFVPYALAEFRNDWPEVEVSLTVRTSARVEEYAAAQQVDFGFVEMPYHTSGLKVEIFSTAPYVVAVPATHKYASRSSLGLMDLADTDFISYSNYAPVRQLLDHSSQTAGVEANYVYEVNLSYPALSMVRRGLGIAIIDPFTAMLCEFGDVKFVALKPSIPFRVSLLRPETRKSNPAMDALIDRMWQLKDKLLTSLPT